MNKRKQFISLAITAAMILSSLPVSAFAAEKDDTVFVTMNIPYNTFYQADIKNDVAVDAVTSATSSKWKTFNGTYHTSAEEGEGGQILGVSFPVEVSREDYAKLKAVNSEFDDYYFTDLAETPSVYKTLTVDGEGNYSFSAVKGEVKDVDEVEYQLSTDSKYGDYQVDLTNTTIDDTVYGVIVTTEDGTQYGLRHLENIWKKSFQFAWSSGVKTTESHGNTLAPAHYESIMGDTIKEITYITDKGITNYSVDAYVPVKTASVVSVADAKTGDDSTTVTVNPALPEDFKASYSVKGLTAEYADGKLSYKDAKAGSYTLTVSDADGKYADISTEFVLSADSVPAAYDDKNKALTAADVSEDEFKSYLGNITSVSVDGTSYAASGKRSVNIIDTKDGNIDVKATSNDTRIFAPDKTEFNVKVTSTGYPDLEFTLTKESEVVFVTMNIPYNTFYQADIKNDVEVDAVTSATERLWTSFSGTYSVANEDGVGGQILGVSFPVAVTGEDYDKLKAVDSESADYYFTVLEETPAVYKTLTIDNKGNYTFSAVKGNVTTVSDSKYSLVSQSVWGDYLFEFSDVDIDGTVYGIIVTSDDGTQYGLRHLENIWKKTYEFAWGSGIQTTEAHGNVLASDHYKSIMGTTIKEVTYITDKGITTYTVDSYVPVKTASVVSVADAKANDASTKVTVEPALPDDFKAVYSVEGLDAEYDDGILSYKDAQAGSYTLTVSDSEGKYADLSAAFVLSTDKLPAKFDSDNKQLAAADASEEEFKAYLRSLTNVKVDDTNYSAAGHGAVAIIDSETGAINVKASSRNNPVFNTENKDTFNITVTAAGYPDLEFTLKIENEVVYVTMNIPYNTFYSSDIKNDVEVDAVTSATERLWTSFSGTYSVANEDGVGGKILGVSFPVEVSREDYAKLKAVDSESADYYFTALEETPAVYKTLTIDDKGNYTFSAVKSSNDVTTVSDSKYSLVSQSVWGDYLFEFSDVEIDGTVYGIIVTADDGTQYGLRHLENIWKKTYEFAWGSGIQTTEAHGNVLASDHYKSIMGTTIKEVTYITDKGITTYTVDSYVPVKTTSVVSVADVKISDTSAKVTVEPALPNDFKAVYSVEGLDAKYADGKISFKDAQAGSYTLTVSDSEGKYADLSAAFTVSTDKVVAKYDSTNKQLVADNASVEEFKAYLKNLTKVKVDDADYSAAGHGAIAIIDPETGKINLDASSRNNPVFDTENKDTFNITVTAAGYPELTFVLSTKDSEPESPKKTYKIGDVNKDGFIDSADSLFILRASVKLENLTDVQETLADVNNDGVVDSADSLAVLRASVKLIDDSNKNVGTEIELDAE